MLFKLKNFDDKMNEKAKNLYQLEVEAGLKKPEFKTIENERKQSHASSAMEFGGDISSDENVNIELSPDKEYNEFMKRKQTLLEVVDEMEGYAQASEEHKFKINEIKHAIEDEE